MHKPPWFYINIFKQAVDMEIYSADKQPDYADKRIMLPLHLYIEMSFLVPLPQVHKIKGLAHWIELKSYNSTDLS